MRTLKLLSLMMLLTLTCVTTEASTAAETAYTTQLKNKKHAKKEPNKKVTSHKKITTNRPSGVVVHYNHKPYLYSHGYYYCQQNGRDVREGETIHRNDCSQPALGLHYRSPLTRQDELCFRRRDL